MAASKTKVFFKNGNPYKEGMFLLVKYKGKNTFAKVEKVNECSVTVIFDGVDGKKVIRYENIVSIMNVIDKK